MQSATETDRASARSRERSDLKHKYRPIGIGAVAAALTVTSKYCEDQASGAANSNDRFGSNGSRAA